MKKKTLSPPKKCKVYRLSDCRITGIFPCIFSILNLEDDSKCELKMCEPGVTNQRSDCKISFVIWRRQIFEQRRAGVNGYST